MKPLTQELTVNLADQVWAPADECTELDPESADTVTGVLVSVALGVVVWGGLFLLAYLVI